MYIANQGYHDEIRFISECYFILNHKGNNMPGVFSGPPGNGKTECIEYFAKDIVNFKQGNNFMFQIASISDTKYDYCGMPMLIDGNSCIVETPLVTVMKNKRGGIMYIDEIDQMPIEVQKDLVSVLDDRRVLPYVKIDEESKKANINYLEIVNKKLFGMFMSYNPDPESSIKRKFHSAFLSRFIEKDFRKLPIELVRAVIESSNPYADESKKKSNENLIDYLNNAPSYLKNKLKVRGINVNLNGVQFFEQNNNSDFVKPNGKIYRRNQIYLDGIDNGSNPKKLPVVRPYLWFDRGDKFRVPKDIPSTTFVIIY